MKLTNLRSMVCSFCSPLSISPPFYGYLKLLTLHRTERSRSKAVWSRNRTWDLLHKGRTLTPCAIPAPIQFIFLLIHWLSLNHCFLHFCFAVLWWASKWKMLKHLIWGNAEMDMNMLHGIISQFTSVSFKARLCAKLLLWWLVLFWNLIFLTKALHSLTLKLRLTWTWKWPTVFSSLRGEMNI